MKVVFVTLYDESARGARYVASAVKAAGHQIAFIHLKAFRSRTIPRRDTEHLAWALAQGPYQLREITQAGERFHPYPSAITDLERRLLVRLIDQQKPDIIGLSFGTHAFLRAIEVTDLIRETRPGVPIVWGGIHATIDPEGSIQHADVVCIGEGEEAFVEYLSDPKRTNIAGLWFRTSTGIIRNPLRPLIQNLDALAWPVYAADEYQVGENGIERRIVEEPGYIACNFYSETTRGCPFTCSYCVHSTTHDLYAGQRYVRPRSSEAVIEEIRQFRSRFGLQAVMPFFDEILFMNKKRFTHFAQLYKREISHPFWGFAHPNTTDREMLEMARDAGSVEISVGIQTGSERIARDIYLRPIDREAIVRLTHDIRDTGAGRLVLNVLADCPFEDEQDLRDTFGLLLDIPRPFLLQLSRVVPFPNTALAKMKCDKPPLPQPVREFWYQLFLLTQSDRLDTETMRELSEDPYLRERPEILAEMVSWILPKEICEQALEVRADQPGGSTAPLQRSGLFHQIYRKVKNRFASPVK
jgi:radical SAM superfamily enzyme YgiQ (UPF0313 family)